MRINPVHIRNNQRRWQIPVAATFLLLLIVVAGVRSPKEVVVATAPPPIPTKKVVIVKKPIKIGDNLEKAVLALEDRPESTLPADVVISLDAIKGKVAAGPIPAGYPLAQALMVNPPSKEKPSEKIEVELNPIDLLLEEKKVGTVAVPVVFSATAPGRGSRVALALTGVGGDTVLILDEGWVSEASGSRAILRVDPSKALFLQSAKKLGSINYIEIPAEGESPYTGHSLVDIASLEIAVGARKEPEKEIKTGAKTSENRQFRSYAWIKGSGERYGIDEKGFMFLVDETGVEIGPVLKNLE